MKLIFLLQRDAWFVEQEQSWYRIEDESHLDIALAGLAVSVVDENRQNIEQPHQAGSAVIEQACDTSIRILLSGPDCEVIVDEILQLDKSRLTSFDWVTGPHSDGWMSADAELTLDNVKHLELEAYLPPKTDSTGKMLTIRNMTDGTSTEVWMERDRSITVPLIQQGSGGAVILRLECEAEVTGKTTESRQLGFVLLGEQIEAA